MRGGGPVSAAAMVARASREEEAFTSRHCSAEEYDAFLHHCGLNKNLIMQRRSLRRVFVRKWPDLNEWMQAPLIERVGRLRDKGGWVRHNRESFLARPYLFYLALKGHLRLDYDWLIAVHDLRVHVIARDLGIDLGVETLAREAERLGLVYANVEGWMRWGLSRLAAHRGPRPINELSEDDVNELYVAVRRFAERDDLERFWMSKERYRSVSKAWITGIGQLRRVLYHRGQISEPQRKIMPKYMVPAVQRQMAMLTDKWLERKAPGLRPATVYHLSLTVRSFLAHLAKIAPEVQIFKAVKREHILSWMNAMVSEPSTKTGRPLTGQSQLSRINRLAQFYKDAEDWGWTEVPRWPLIAHRDLPRRIQRVPRYIPAADLSRVMEAIRRLSCPFQRAALLVARWSGARRGEITRLTTDCLDSYPDGTARLRIPVGKTSRERMVPLHDEAAEALRAVLALRASGTERLLRDERTGEMVRFVFVQYGKAMTDGYLFARPLRRISEELGLVDANGKATITAHRFRHTMGTELAERGAKLHTVMSVLGHESPQMAMVYARISDAEVLRDYRSVLEPGALIAGAGAEAIRSGMDAATVDWLRSNFLKTELELGHCLRLPSEGPCECDLYLSCSRFVTTPAYAPRLRERRRLEMSLADDARMREWPREVERHCAVARRIECLLTDLGEAVEE